MDFNITNAMSRLTINNDVAFLPTMLGKALETKIYSAGAAEQAIAAGLLVCRLGISGINTIQKGNFEELDPLVSDTLCHTRTSLIVGIAKEVLNKESSLSKAFENSKNALEELKEKLTKSREMYNKAKSSYMKTPYKTTIGELFGNDLQLKVPQDVITVALSYMLTKTKVEKKEKMRCVDCKQMVDNLSEITCEGKLDRFQKNIESGTRNSIVTTAKETLSKIGCNYMHKLAIESSSKTVQDMLGNTNLKVINSLSILPFVYTVQAMFDGAVKQNTPILIKSKLSEHTVDSPHEKFDTAFLLHEGKIQLLDDKTTDEIKNMPAIIIAGQRTGKMAQEEGIESYRKRFLKIPFAEILEMNATHHSQYIGGLGLESIPLLEKEQNELQRLKLIKQRAEQEGCCNINHSLYKIYHIFCDTISNQLKKGNIVL